MTTLQVFLTVARWFLILALGGGFGAAVVWVCAGPADPAKPPTGPTSGAFDPARPSTWDVLPPGYFWAVTGAEAGCAGDCTGMHLFAPSGTDLTAAVLGASRNGDIR